VFERKSNLGVFRQRCAPKQSFFNLQGCQRREKSSPNDLKSLHFENDLKSLHFENDLKNFENVSENCRKQDRKTAPLTEEMQPSFVLFFKNQKNQLQLKI
jgi:hypothetical protein